MDYFFVSNASWQAEKLGNVSKAFYRPVKSRTENMTNPSSLIDKCSIIYAHLFGRKFPFFRRLYRTIDEFSQNLAELTIYWNVWVLHLLRTNSSVSGNCSFPIDATRAAELQQHKAGRPSPANQVSSTCCRVVGTPRRESVWEPCLFVTVNGKHHCSGSDQSKRFLFRAS